MEKLKNSSLALHNNLVSIFSNLSFGVVAFSLDGKITIANSLFIANLNLSYPITEITQKTIFNCISQIPELELLVTKCLTNKCVPFNLNDVEYQGAYLQFHGNPIENGMIITVEDVTDKKEADMATFRTLLRGQEAERKRIATEIHDGLGPMLSAIKMHLQAIQGELGPLSNTIIKKLDSTYQLIDGVAHDMRNLSHDLMPRVVEDFGLAEALLSLSKTLSNRETVITFTQNVNGERFSKIIELNLYRLAQELIHNALKYSRANKISLQLLKHTSSLILMVEDNGVGFDNSHANVNGIGLKNMETRVMAMGGILTIDSVPHVGVTATAEIFL